MWRGVAEASSDTDAQVESNSTIAHLFARVGPEGEVDKQLAIDAFSYLFAPLPGATSIEGDPPELHEIKSGTFAYRWLAQHADELTDDQRAAVAAHLTPGPNDTVIRSTDPEPTALALTGGGFVAASEEHARYVRILKEAEAGFAQKVGETLKRPWMLVIRESSNGTALAGTRMAAFPFLGSIGLFPTFGCSFETYKGFRDLDETSIRTTLAHEMWHCFQGQLGGFRIGPPWLIEGQAEWAGEALMGPSAVGIPNFSWYVQTPRDPLFGRDYDAAGFYWQLSEHGISPWTHAKAMLLSITNAGIFEAAGANSQSFLQDWAPQLLRDSAIGPELQWHTKGIFAVAERGGRAKVNVSVAVSRPRFPQDRSRTGRMKSLPRRQLCGRSLDKATASSAHPASAPSMLGMPCCAPTPMAAHVRLTRFGRGRSR